MSTIVVVGMKSEAKIASKLGYKVIFSGGSFEKLTQRMEKEISLGATRFISFGVAGGACAYITTQDIILASWVTNGSNKYYCDKVWASEIWNNRYLLRPFRQLQRGGIFGVRQPLPNNLKTQFDYHGCNAVDMESFIVGQVASQYGLPFIVIRAISDDLNTYIPEFVIACTKANGTINLPKLIVGLLRNIRELPNFCHLAWQARHAFSNLNIMILLIRGT